MRGVVLSFAFALFLASACGGDDDPGGSASTGGSGGTGGGGSGGTGGSSGSDASTGLEDELDAAGFSVQSGKFEVIDIADCCAEGKSCSGNNPTSPYGAFYLPRAIGQTVANPSEGRDRKSVV